MELWKTLEIELKLLFQREIMSFPQNFSIMFKLQTSLVRQLKFKSQSYEILHVKKPHNIPKYTVALIIEFCHPDQL